MGYKPCFPDEIFSPDVMCGYKCPVTAVIATAAHGENPQIHLPLVSLLGLHTQYLFPQR